MPALLFTVDDEPYANASLPAYPISPDTIPPMTSRQALDTMSLVL